MPDNTMKHRIMEILADKNLTKNEKLETLKEMQANARDIQRAATESGMAADDDGQNDNLREIERALHKLGIEADGPEHTGAATL